MRVEYNTIDDFLSDLKDDKEAIWNGVVRIRIDRMPKGESEVNYQVFIQLSAVSKQEGGDFLMEMNGYCGEDIEDGSPDLSGTETAQKYEKIVKGHCERIGLKTRPGKYEIY